MSNKKQHVCLASSSVENWTDKETENILQFYCLNLILVSLPSWFVLIFVYSLETYLKWKVPFDTVM